MTPKALKALIATLREQGVCRYRYKGPKVEVELELFQHAPAPTQKPATIDPARDRIQPQLPEPLRAVIEPGEFEAAIARARRLGVGTDD